MSPAPTRPVPGAAPAAGKRATAAKPGVVRPSQTSRLFESLMKEAQTAPDRVAWARAVCRAAGHQARAGQADRALQFIANVRTQFGPGLHPEVASWLMLAEGVLHWCKFEMRPAYDRMIRAYALGVALRSTATPSCAAWLSVLELNECRFEKAIEYLNKVFSMADPRDHAARARATLTLGCAHMIAGEYDIGQTWIEESRRHMVAEGDEAMLGAMLFNVAAVRMSGLRIKDAFDESIQDSLWRSSLEGGGSASFDYLTRNETQVAWRQLMMGRQFLLEKKYSEARSMLKLVKDHIGINESNRNAVLIDIAWCCYHLDDSAAASELLSEAVARMPDVSDTDDRAYCLARASRLLSYLGNASLAEELGASAVAALGLHKEFQSNLSMLLRQVIAEKTM